MSNELDPKELEIDVYRHPSNTDVNQGSNCIRVKHVPTGIVVKSEERGSYRYNRDLAFEELKRKLQR